MGAQAVRLSNVDIDNALKDKDFEVLFQPIFDLGNGALARVETFIRWRHPTLGVLPPGAFISFFETQGRMSELTRYVLAEALSAYQDWRGAHAPGFSINLALTDLSDETFPSHFARLLRERGFPPELVTLECPMPAVEADMATTARQLVRLAETGARLAIEVRGRANDFLKTVRPFPFAEIKTGGAAILRFARTVRGPGLSAISELLELAAEQNAAITAVGVEDQASLAALRGLGFAAAQGNHLGKVGPLSQFMPSQVNEVRALLGLEPLSSDDLATLFRTGAPRPAPAADADDAGAVAPPGDDAMAPVDELPEFETPKRKQRVKAPPAPASDDELIERLARRISRNQGTTPDATDTATDAAPDAEAKAAAIARARRNGLMRKKLEAKNALAEKADARGESAAARDMQERLSREFGAFAESPADEPRDDFEMVDAEQQGVGAGIAEAVDAAHLDAETENAPGMTASDEAEGAEAEPQRAAAGRMKASHLAVPNARARFTPTLRVSGPELIAPVDDGDLGDLGDLSADEMPGDDADAKMAHPLPSAPAEDAEDEIPTPMSNAQWLEETVAVEAEVAAEGACAVTRKAKKWWRGKYRLPRYSGHFWPRAIRKRMKRRNRRVEKLAAE